MRRGASCHPGGVIFAPEGRGFVTRRVPPYPRISCAGKVSYVKYSTGANVTIRIIFHALRKPDPTVARQGVRTTDSVTITRTTERHAFSRVSAISRPQALFSPPSFLLREKRWCPRSDSYSVAVKTVSPVNPEKSAAPAGAVFALRVKRCVTPPGRQKRRPFGRRALF